MENENIDAERNKHGKKRSAAQRAADLAFIEGHVLRGRTQLRGTPYHPPARPTLGNTPPLFSPTRNIFPH